jgi:hypothetical protein
MFVVQCARCGETSIEASEQKTIECAGESAVLCPHCYDQFRTWFYAGAFQNTDPALARESARG